MRMLKVAVLVALSACTGPWLRRERAPDGDHAQTLPLLRVRLYASGVGYFERRGRLHSEADTLPVPTSHLDDAIKSLVLLSPHGQLGSVTFASRLSPAVARARAGLSAEEEESLSYDRLLASLRGEQVEARVHGQSLRGRVVEVLAVGPSHPSYEHDDKPRPEDAADEPEVLQLMLLSESGALVRFDARELESLKALSPVVVERLEAALAARLSLRSGRPQALALGAHAGEELALAYLAETPVWRPSYRLLLDDEHPNTASLQAWALVHNDTDETWSGVAVELATGEPESFLFPLSAPRYNRRALHMPDRELSSVPQLSTTTPDAMWGDFSNYEGEEVERLGESSDSGYGIGSGSSRGHGSGVGGRGHAALEREQTEFEASRLLVLGDLTHSAAVDAVPEAAVSVFPVASRLALPPHHSALVPFIEGPISTRAMAWFGALDAEPERAISIRNDTANSLPPGPVAVFSEGGFQGEAELESLKPGERRFARIGREPEIELTVLGQLESSEERRLTFEGGKLGVHLVRSADSTLRLTSRSDRRREVYITLDVVTNATVTGADRLDYDRTTGTAFAIYDVEPGAVRELRLVTHEGLLRTIEVSAITSHELEGLLDVSSLPAQERSVVKLALPSTQQVETVREQQTDLAGDIEATEDDVKRLREHLATLTKGEGGAAQQQLVSRILERDEQLRTLKAKNRVLSTELARKRVALAEVLHALTETSADHHTPH